MNFSPPSGKKIHKNILKLNTFSTLSESNKMSYECMECGTYGFMVQKRGLDVDRRKSVLKRGVGEKHG